MKKRKKRFPNHSCSWLRKRLLDTYLLIVSLIAGITRHYFFGPFGTFEPCGLGILTEAFAADFAKGEAGVVRVLLRAETVAFATCWLIILTS